MSTTDSYVGWNCCNSSYLYTHSVRENVNAKAVEPY